MINANYAEVATVEQVPPGKGITARVSGKDLFNVDGTIYGSPLLDPYD